MAATPRVLVFAGSTREQSWNKILARTAAQAIDKAGGQATFIDLRDYPLPLLDEDLERTTPPENAAKLKALFADHQGLLIAAPEYNSSITGVLKNTIDWVSRSRPGESPLFAFKGKVAALMSASPGALGGLRGLVHLRAILGNIGVLVLPDQLAIPKANEAIRPDGTFTDPGRQTAVENIARQLVETIAKLRA